MTRHILRRLIQAIPTIFGITILSYLLMTAAPGGPARILFFDPDIPPEVLEQQMERLGLNDPVPIQYLSWLTGTDWMWWKEDSWQASYDVLGQEAPPRPLRYGIIRGDFGRSFTAKRDALQMIL